jgi:hypothetical protein
MMIYQITLLVVVIIFGLVIFWSIYKDAMTRKQNFEIQIAMAKAQESMKNPLTFDEIKRIVESIIVNLCIVEVTTNGYWRMSDEELSIHFEKILLDIATTTESYLSGEIIRQWEKFTTVDYRTRYIIFTVREVLMLQINNTRTKNIPVKIKPVSQRQKTNDKKVDGK